MMRKLLALALCLALFAACNSEAPEETVQEMIVGEEPIGESSELTFTNEEYGFMLSFPEIWEGFIATPFEEVEYTEGPGFYFGFDEEYADMIIAVSIHSQEDWAELQSFEGPKPTYLGENDNWVFASSASHEAPEAYQEHRMNYQDVFDTFEVL